MDGQKTTLVSLPTSSGDLSHPVGGEEEGSEEGSKGCHQVPVPAHMRSGGILKTYFAVIPLPHTGLRKMGKMGKNLPGQSQISWTV